jgi:hypothetical protein
MTTLVQLLSGRKKESSVWDYFTFDDTANKSRCTVPTGNGEECGFLMAGKRTSNLKLHIKAKHPSIFSEIEKEDNQNRKLARSVKRKSECLEDQGL